MRAALAHLLSNQDLGRGGLQSWCPPLGAEALPIMQALCLLRKINPGHGGLRGPGPAHPLIHSLILCYRPSLSALGQVSCPL